MSTHVHKIPIGNVVREVKVDIRATGATRFRARMALGGFIMRIGARVGGFRNVRLDID